MSEQDDAYGSLIRVDPTGNSSEEVLRRIPLGTSAAQGGMNDDALSNYQRENVRFWTAVLQDAFSDVTVEVPGSRIGWWWPSGRPVTTGKGQGNGGGSIALFRETRCTAVP